MADSSSSSYEPPPFVYEAMNTISLLEVIFVAWGVEHRYTGHRGS